jgi:hypothetical protein
MKRIRCFFFHRDFWKETGWFGNYTDLTCDKCGCEWSFLTKNIKYKT